MGTLKWGENVDLKDLWDVQVVAFAATSTLIVVFVLIVLAVVMRRLRCLTSEFESIRQEMRLLEEGVKTVSEGLLGQATKKSGE